MRKAAHQKTLSLVPGALTGLLVLMSSGFQYQLSASGQREVENIEESDEQSKEAQISTLDAVSNVVSGHLILPILLTFGEINFERGDLPRFEIDFTPSYRFFKTLFRRIIAPNAP